MVDKLLLSYFALIFSVFGNDQNIDLVHRDVVVRLVDRDGNSAEDQSVAPIKFQVEIEAKKSGEHLSDQLRSNGIYPSAEAFALYYELNPDVIVYESVHVGSEMRIPKLSQTVGLSEKLADGYMVRIFADTKLKSRLTNTIANLKEAQARFVGNNQMAFESAASKASILANLEEIVDRLQDLSHVVADDQRPVDSQMLTQVVLEGVLLVDTLNRAAVTARFLHSDEEKVDVIQRDLLTKAEGFDASRVPGETPPRSPSALVDVSIRPTTNMSIGRLRICYVPEALEGEDDFCTATTGAPKIISLPLAMYKMWAATNEKSAPATAKVRVSVKDGNITQAVDLLLGP